MKRPLAGPKPAPDKVLAALVADRDAMRLELEALRRSHERISGALQSVRDGVVAPVLVTSGGLDPFEHVGHGLSTASSGYEYLDAQLMLATQHGDARCHAASNGWAGG